MERERGGKQTLGEATGRTIKLRKAKAGNPDRLSIQYSLTVPKPIGELMEKRSTMWRFTLVDEGVLAVPVDAEGNGLPEWARR